MYGFPYVAIMTFVPYMYMVHKTTYKSKCLAAHAFQCMEKAYYSYVYITNTLCKYMWHFQMAF
jgi:hypothetical protein